MRDQLVLAHFAWVVGSRIDHAAPENQWRQLLECLTAEELHTWLGTATPGQRASLLSSENSRLSMMACAGLSWTTKRVSKYVPALSEAQERKLPALSSEQETELQALLAQNNGDVIATFCGLMEELKNA